MDRCERSRRSLPGRYSGSAAPWQGPPAGPALPLARLPPGREPSARGLEPCPSGRQDVLDREHPESPLELVRTLSTLLCLPGGQGSNRPGPLESGPSRLCNPSKIRAIAIPGSFDVYVLEVSGLLDPRGPISPVRWLLCNDWVRALHRLTCPPLDREPPREKPDLASRVPSTVPRVTGRATGFHRWDGPMIAYATVGYQTC